MVAAARVLIPPWNGAFAPLEAETERYVVCNADEGEPGTFKDRVLLNSYALPGIWRHDLMRLALLKLNRDSYIYAVNIYI